MSVIGGADPPLPCLEWWCLPPPAVGGASPSSPPPSPPSLRWFWGGGFPPPSSVWRCLTLPPWVVVPSSPSPSPLEGKHHHPRGESSTCKKGRGERSTNPKEEGGRHHHPQGRAGESSSTPQAADQHDNVRGHEHENER